MSVPPVQPSKSGDVVKSRNRRALWLAAVIEPMEMRTLLSGVNFLAPPIDIPIAGTANYPAYLADLNGDGFPDIITGFQEQTTAKSAGSKIGGIASLISNGDGNFAAPTAEYDNVGIYSPPGATPIVDCSDGLLATAFGDVTGDGNPDVIVAKSSYMQRGPGTTIIIHPPSIIYLQGNNASALLLGAGTGGETTFANAEFVVLKNTPTSIALGNFYNSSYLGGQNSVSGDGTPDLVITYGYQNSIAILPLQATLTTTGTATTTPTSTGTPSLQIPVGGVYPTATAVADLRGDGLDDVITANKRNNTVSVLLGIGNGKFLPPQVLSVGPSPTNLLVTDLNGDGIPDIVTTNAGNNTISVLLGRGNGTFKKAETFSVGADPVSVAAGDLTGNGKIDLVTADATGNSLSVLMGNGDGTFQSAQNVPLNAIPATVTLGDLTNLTDTAGNSTGALDVIVTSNTLPAPSGGIPVSAQVQVLMNTNANQPHISVTNGIANITGTSGNDTIGLSVSGTSLVVQVNTTSQSLAFSSIGTINVYGLAGNDSITIGAGVPPIFVGGGGGNDTIVGQSSSAETFRGGAGNDSLTAGSGDDFLSGGAGNDTLVTGSGNDTLNGNSGNDSLIGGIGSSYISGGPGNDTIDAFGGSGTDSGVDTLVGGTGSNLILESPGDSVLPGTSGDTVRTI
jgi:Ca2+-binding RTX toxin-like protein